jgi:hypothetical protein
MCSHRCDSGSNSRFYLEDRPTTPRTPRDGNRYPYRHGPSETQPQHHHYGHSEIQPQHHHHGRSEPQRQPQYYRPSRSETQPRYHRSNYADHQRQSAQLHSAVPVPSDVHLGIGLEFGHTPNHPEPRLSHSVHYECNAPSDYPLSPSPSPRIPQRWQILRSASDHQEPGIDATGPGHRLPSECAPSPQRCVADNGDIYDLDVSLVKCEIPNHVPTIHCSPLGDGGSQGRWYYVSHGRKVGIFNEWYVCLLSRYSI